MNGNKPVKLEVKFRPSDISVDIMKPRINVGYESAEIGVKFDPEKVTIIPEAQIIRDSGEAPIYQGDTEVTPSKEEHILHTSGYLLTSDVRVNPIPSNYGLITWDGSVLTVS